MLEDLKLLLQDIITKVMLDDDLNEDIRDQIVNLAEETLENPTPANIEAFSIVLSKIGDAEDYMGAMTTLNLLKNKEEMLKEENEDNQATIATSE